MKLPGPDHPITVTPDPRRIIVRFDGQVIADTRRALTLVEARYPPVHYIPRADVAVDRLVRSTQASHCPYKGDASYFSIQGANARAADAVWSYEAPYDAVAVIKDHLAFYPSRVDAIEVLPP